MNTKDYGEQFDQQVAAAEKVQAIIDQLDAEGTGTDDDWNEVWKVIKAGIGPHNADLLPLVTEASTESTWRERTIKLNTLILEHYRTMQAMTSQTASILGGLGVQGIKFV